MADNQAPLDGWTLVHAASGFIARRIGLSSRHTLALGIAYEIIEQGIERRPDNIFGAKNPESLSNAAVDVFVMMAVYHLTR